MGYQLFEFESLKDCHKALIERFKEFFNTTLKKHHQVSIAFSGGRLELEASWVFIDTLIEGFINNATPLYSYESHNLNESEFLKPLYQ